MQIAVERSDGTPYNGFFNRQINIMRVHEGVGSRQVPEEKVVIPDDSLVRYTFYPGDNDEKITVTVSICGFFQHPSSHTHSVHYILFTGTPP
jgi:hypothetical protein